MFISLVSILLSDVLLIIRSYAGVAADPLMLSSQLLLCVALGAKTSALFLILAHFNHVFGEHNLSQLSKPFFHTSHYRLYRTWGTIAMFVYVLYIGLQLIYNYGNELGAHKAWNIAPFILHNVESAVVIVLLVSTYAKLQRLASDASVSSFVKNVVQSVAGPSLYLIFFAFADVTAIFILSIRILASSSSLTWDPLLISSSSIVVDIFTKIFTLGYVGEMYLFTKLIFREATAAHSPSPDKEKAAISAAGSNPTKALSSTRTAKVMPAPSSQPTSSIPLAHINSNDSSPLLSDEENQISSG
jgi:hypothetical protein